MNAPKHLRTVVACVAAFAGPVAAGPACAVGPTTNLVVMSVKPLPNGRPWLQATNSGTRIILERCSYSVQPGGVCYFAPNVPAGRYYFQQVLTGAMNDLTYPVSTASLWFDISPLGLTYLGDWKVEFGDQRNVRMLQIRYDFAHLDAMRSLCELPPQRLFLARAKQPLAEVID